MADKDEYRELERQKQEKAKQSVKKEEKVQPEASLKKIGGIDTQKRQIKRKYSIK